MDQYKDMTMEEINLKQKEFWSGSGGDVWVNKQSEMDIMLNPLGTKAISKLDLSKTKKIIDIGCGCGATTLEIARQLGEGEIIGVDISEPMQLGQLKMLLINLYQMLIFKFWMCKLTICHRILILPFLDLA